MNEWRVREFVDELHSKAPVPGGGGAAALAGALSAALAGMVANLTVEKKGYEAVWEDMESILQKTKDLKERFLLLIEEDALAYRKVAEAYRCKALTEEEKRKRSEKIEERLKDAAMPPLKMLEALAEGEEILEELAKKGNRFVLSDVGIGAFLLEAARKASVMNVKVNTALMKRREVADILDDKVQSLLKQSEGRVRKIVETVEAKIG